MRVAHIGHVPCPAEHPEAGRICRTAFYPGRWVLNLALAQAALGLQPSIVVKAPGSHRNWTTQVEGIPVHFVSLPNIARGKTFFYLDQRLLSRFVRNLAPDIVHAHGTEEANALAALRTGLPRLLTLQGCFFMINRRIPAKFYSRQWIVERLERRSIPRFRHVITKSDYIRREVEAEFPGIQTHLIPNTYNPKLDGIPSGQPKENAIAFVGSIDPRKGVDLIVQALSGIGSAEEGIAQQPSDGSSPTPKLFAPPIFARSSPLALHVFGNRADCPTNYEQSTIRDLQSIRGVQVVLHGLVDQFEMARIVARCKALVAPSREEMFGNQVVEALLVGTHAIVSDGTAMAENVRRFGNGTVVPQEDSRSLARAITNALVAHLHPASGVENSPSAARRLVQESLSPNRVAADHLDLYKMILERSKPFSP